MRFADEVAIRVTAGNGGNGCLSFLRERARPKGGPDGGNGGSGGSVYLHVDDSLISLANFHNSSILRAGHGGSGAGKKRHGKNGADLELSVPMGTLAYVRDTDELIADLTSVRQRAMVARGGDGGKGNAHFRSSTNRAPRKTTQGTIGEDRWLRLELRMLADLGLVGKPNAGKSTMLSALSSAQPKTAPYPFTTLAPQLGITPLPDGEQRAVIADIPGLIAGAAKGRGLGHQFLRHLMRTRLLLHLVDISGDNPAHDWREINKELAAYSPELEDRQQWLIVNKTDLLPAHRTAQQCADELAREIAWEGPYFAVSALQQDGLTPLLLAIQQHLSAERADVADTN